MECLDSIVTILAAIDIVSGRSDDKTSLQELALHIFWYLFKLFKHPSQTEFSANWVIKTQLVQL